VAKNWFWHLHNSPDHHTLVAGDAARALKASRAALRETGHDTARTLGDIRALRAAPPRWLADAQQRKRDHRHQVASARAGEEQAEENRRLAADDFLFLRKAGVPEDEAVNRVDQKWGLSEY
jgi:hypothetical protein